MKIVAGEGKAERHFWAVRRRAVRGTGVLAEGGPAGGKIELAKVGIGQSTAGQSGPQS